jgi:hypothetical protein
MDARGEIAVGRRESRSPRPSRRTDPGRPAGSSPGARAPAMFIAGAEHRPAAQILTHRHQPSPGETLRRVRTKRSNRCGRRCPARIVEAGCGAV